MDIINLLLDKEFILKVRYINDTIWYYYNIGVIIPLTLLVLYRLFFPKDFSQVTDKNPLKTDIWDRIAQSCFFYGFIYYIFDLYVYLALRVFNVCFIAYTTHHITSIWFLPCNFKLNYYNWWQLIVPLFHGVIFYYKDNTLAEICYLLSVIVYHIGVKSRVCKDLARYKKSNIALRFIYIAIIMMFFGNCREM